MQYHSNNFFPIILIKYILHSYLMYFFYAFKFSLWLYEKSWCYVTYKLNSQMSITYLHLHLNVPRINLQKNMWNSWIVYHIKYSYVMIIQQVCFDNWPSRTQWDVHLEVMTPHWNERSVAHETFWHNILYHFNIIYIIKGNGFQTLHSRKSKLINFITDKYHTTTHA